MSDDATLRRPIVRYLRRGGTNPSFPASYIYRWTAFLYRLVAQRTACTLTNSIKEKMATDDGTFSKPGAEAFAAIMTSQRPNPYGPGYLKLYSIAGTVFLCSTMSGELEFEWCMVFVTEVRRLTMECRL
jgi:hypothetical protein